VRALAYLGCFWDCGPCLSVGVGPLMGTIEGRWSVDWLAFYPELILRIADGVFGYIMMFGVQVCFCTHRVLQDLRAGKGMTVAWSAANAFPGRSSLPKSGGQLNGRSTQ